MMLKVQNRILAKKARHCRSVLSKSIGLMFSKLGKDEALIMYFKKDTMVDLHMMMVFHAIDVIYANDGIVVDLVSNFKPFSYYNAKKPADMVIELPNGVVLNNKIKIGDKVRLSFD